MMQRHFVRWPIAARRSIFCEVPRMGFRVTNVGSCVLICLALCLAAGAADFKNVQFAEVDGVRLTMDAHVPEGVGPFPAAVLVHGGGWVAGDKQQYITYIFQPLSDAGFAWFSINYRLAPQYKFPADADDVETAIRFVKANAARYKSTANKQDAK